MQRVTIVPADGFISIDGRGFQGLDLSALDPQIHAVQWFGTRGEMELVPDENGRPANIAIASIAFVQSALDAWQIAADAEDNPPPPWPEDAAAQRINDLSGDCEAAITAGFVSAALGADHTYQSDRDDQLNLVGAAQAGTDMPFKCADSAGVWEYRQHTADQIRQVLADGAAVKLAHLQAFAQKKGMVEAIAADATMADEEKRAAIAQVVW
jgi:hypothetical protein